jgi:hypothetical protein
MINGGPGGLCALQYKYSNTKLRQISWGWVRMSKAGCARADFTYIILNGGRGIVVEGHARYFLGSPGRGSRGHSRATLAARVG